MTFSLKTELAQVEVPAGGAALYWLGQAGFAFRTAAGRRIFLDPYLSDACERLHGFKRLSLPAILAEEVEADWVILTHEHTDHLDPDPPGDRPPWSPAASGRPNQPPNSRSWR